jgi:VCBS repeat-containing protein
VLAPGVLGNDTDADGDSLTAVKVTNPAHGAVTLDANGSFTYTPTAYYSGPDSFTYTVNDGTADSNTATVSIAVTTVDDAPVAADTSATTTAGVAVQIQLNATDLETCEQTFAIVSEPSHGSLGPLAAAPCTAGSPNGDRVTVTYTPAAGYSGTDSFTFRSNDGALASNTATVSITVNPASNTIHVSDLDWTRASGSKWKATVTVQVHNASHAVVSGATVRFGVTGGVNTTKSCKTSTNGSCSVSVSVSNSRTSVTFAVTNVTRSDRTYQPSDNHDPDAPPQNSNGTTITVTKP